jgi:hypothetical protein
MTTGAFPAPGVSSSTPNQDAGGLLMDVARRMAVNFARLRSCLEKLIARRNLRPKAANSAANPQGTGRTARSRAVPSVAGPPCTRRVVRQEVIGS